MYEESESTFCSKKPPIPDKPKQKEHLNQMNEEKKKRESKDTCLPLREVLRNDIKETLKEQLAIEHAKTRKFLRKEILGPLGHELRQIRMEQMAQLREDVKETLREQVKETLREREKEPLPEQVKETLREGLKEMLREGMKEMLREGLKEMLREHSNQQYLELKECLRDNLKEMVREQIKNAKVITCPKEAPLHSISKGTSDLEVEEKKSTCLYEPNFRSFKHRISALLDTAPIEPAPAAYTGDADDTGAVDKARKAELALALALALPTEHQRGQPHTNPEPAPGHLTGDTMNPAHSADLNK